MSAYSQKFLKQRKFYTVLPLIVLPFVTVMFWLMGGGSGEKTSAPKKNGLNMQLPDANLKSQSALDKLSFYAMADRDSVKHAEQLRMDPNYQPVVTTSETKVDADRKSFQMPKQMDEPVYAAPVERGAADIDRLQAMVQTINQHKTDPEIDALNGTLEKLIEMQHPSAAKIVSQQSGKVFSVSADGVNDERSYFGNAAGKKVSGFLSDADESKDPAKRGVIAATVHGEQILTAGSVIKLRLLQDVFVNGQRIPAGSFVFGSASIDNERLKISVGSIQFQNHLYPVALTVYDMDGIEGINIPGSSGRDVIKQSADQGLQSVGGFSFDPSLKAQAAAAGVNAAKSLLSKKVKLVRVTVKAGYKVLLKDENEKSN